jgi:hypothetical protein
MTTQPTALHARLKLRLEHHAYKKGQHKGAAPADQSKRYKDHFRVENLGQYIAVVFHSTHIIRAYPDGSVVLSANGWGSSPTTREAFAHYGFRLATIRHGSYRQSALCTWGAYSGPAVPWEDGIRLVSGDTWHYRLDPTYKPKPFLTRVADKETRKEWRTDPDVQAFRAALPVLHAALSAMPYVERSALSWTRPSVRQRPTSACDVHENWPVIVAVYYRDTPAETWGAYYADATKGMTCVEEVL